MPLSVDLDTIHSLTALRDAGVAEAEFHSDGTLSRARFVPALAVAPSPAPVDPTKDPVLEARRADYENLLNRQVGDGELKRLP